MTRTCADFPRSPFVMRTRHPRHFFALGGRTALGRAASCPSQAGFKQGFAYFAARLPLTPAAGGASTLCQVTPGSGVIITCWAPDSPASTLRGPACLTRRAQPGRRVPCGQHSWSSRLRRWPFRSRSSCSLSFSMSSSSAGGRSGCGTMSGPCELAVSCSVRFADWHTPGPSHGLAEARCRALPRGGDSLTVQGFFPD